MRSLSILCLALTILACGGEGPAPVVVVAADPEPARAPEVVVAAAPVKAPQRDAEVSEGPIGVAVCDAYVSTYRRCVDTAIPEDERAAHREVIAEQRVAWSRAKADAALARGLADACAAAKLAARTSLPRCKGW